MKGFTLLLFLMLGSFVSVFAQSSTSLEGIIIDERDEPVMFAEVSLKKNGVIFKGIRTDYDGTYFFNGIEAGMYDVVVSYVGYQTKTTVGVVVLAGKKLTLDVKILQGVGLEDAFIIYEEPTASKKDND
jgi:hypothetical protein